MNVKTLAPLHPGCKRLSAHQLISLHLYLYRPPGDDTKESTDTIFGPFISILPREFDSHPLAWLVYEKLGDGDEAESTLLALLPRSMRSALNALEERFERDSNAVSEYLVSFVLWIRQNSD